MDGSVFEIVVVWSWRSETLSGRAELAKIMEAALVVHMPRRMFVYQVASLSLPQ